MSISILVEYMKETPKHGLTPDKHHWYDQMIRRGFNERNENYFSVFPQGNPSEIFTKALLKAGNRNRRMLDIGCGPGKYTEMWAPNYAQIVGLDRSSESLAYGREHRTAPNLEFVLGDSRMLAFPDDSFDVAVTRLSPHSLAEMIRVLKPRGLAFCMRVGETDALELRRLFGQVDLVKKMEGYMARGEPHSRHIAEEWREVGFEEVKSAEFEYDMHFKSALELAKYLSRIPIIPEFDIHNPQHMLMLQHYAVQNTDVESGAVILHRHRSIITGSKSTEVCPPNDQ